MFVYFTLFFVCLLTLFFVCLLTLLAYCACVLAYFVLLTLLAYCKMPLFYFKKSCTDKHSAKKKNALTNSHYKPRFGFSGTICTNWHPGIVGGATFAMDWPFNCSPLFLNTFTPPICLKITAATSSAKGLWIGWDLSVTHPYCPAGVFLAVQWFVRDPSVVFRHTLGIQQRVYMVHLNMPSTAELGFWFCKQTVTVHVGGLVFPTQVLMWARWKEKDEAGKIKYFFSNNRPLQTDQNLLEVHRYTKTHIPHSNRVL